MATSKWRSLGITLVTLRLQSIFIQTASISCGHSQLTPPFATADCCHGSYSHSNLSWSGYSTSSKLDECGIGFQKKYFIIKITKRLSLTFLKLSIILAKLKYIKWKNCSHLLTNLLSQTKQCRCISCRPGTNWWRQVLRILASH